MARSLLLTVLFLLAGCDFFRMPSNTVAPLPPDEVTVVTPINAKSCGILYLRAVADAFDAHADSLEAKVPELQATKDMRKTLTAAPEASFLPLMKQMAAVPKGEDQIAQRIILDRKFAKELRGVK